MADEIAVGERLTKSLGWVRGVAAGPAGTGHLLYAAARDPATAPLLNAFEITPIVVRTVLGTPGRAAAEPDAAGIAGADDPPAAGACDDAPRMRDTFGRLHPLSAAAAAALRSSGDSPAGLLAAMLADPGSEAAAVVRDCGADPDELRRAVRNRTAPQRPDRLPAALRPARDALLCRVRYRGRGVKDRLLFSVLAREINHAARPVLWTRLEADRLAARQHRATRTDDVLLALLITHEVAAGYPHLSAVARRSYGGGDALRARNITHETVRAAALGDARADDVPPGRILVPGPDWTEDTGVLLDRLAAHPGNRSSRLLAALR